MPPTLAASIWLTGYLAIGLEEVEGGTLVRWRQVFDAAEHFKRAAPLVRPANEHKLDRLAAEVKKVA
ncbi:MAG: hypothetical protein JO006_15405 [Paucibacter sp.]|nr:hypothetical protein [Roseateles sp.]